MNREIKFRGKNVDNGEWVYGDFCREINSKKLIYLIVETRENGTMDFYHVNPDTVGQYTGRADAYEGDIFIDGYSMYVIVWDKKTSGFRAKLYPRSLPLNLFTNEELKRKIGNIHDNPELMEKKHGKN